MDQVNVSSTQLLAEKIQLRKPKKKNDTYGTICFQGFGSEASRNAPYVRVSVPNEGIDVMAKKDARKLWELMKDGWKVPRPQLIISVTGGAQDFYMNQRLLNGFKRGLMSLATTAGAWIVTGGTKTGVMEIVGEAARDHMLKNGRAEQNIVLLGVVDWKMVANKKLLVSPEEQRGLFPCRYEVNYEQTVPANQQQPTATTVGDAKKDGPKQSFLDPNHTHFVLVDNGTETGAYGGEIEFRAYLEQKIGKRASKDGANRKQQTGKLASDGGVPVSNSCIPVPTVLLVLEGGKGTLQTVCETIKKKIPVVVIAGSGRAADLIAYALENKDSWNPEDLDCLMQTAKLLKLEQAESAIKTCARYVDDLVKMKNQKLLVVYEQTDEDIQHDLDVAVIKALIEAQRNKSGEPDVASQLKLALAWNRADVAKTEILNAGRRTGWKQEDVLYPVLFDALVQDKDEFVQTLLDTGVNLKKFLTVAQLAKLYDKVVDETCSGISASLLRGLIKINNAKKPSCDSKNCYCCGIRRVADVKKTEPILKAVSKLITDLTNDYRKRLSREVAESTEFEQPERELFLWALLLKRKNLALTFWKLGRDHVGGALVASMLSKSLAEVADQQDDLVLADQFRADASEYEALATGILDECYSKDKETSHRLLTRNLETWGDRTLFVLANDSELMDFMETSCCQTLLNKIWMGRMALSTPMWKILISLIVPFGCLTIVYTDHDDEINHNVEKPSDDNDNGHTSSESADNGSNGNDNRNTQEADHKGRAQRKGVIYKFYYYYTAPIVNFCYFTIAYIVFLGLFSFFVLTDLVPDNPSVYEYIAWGWALTMFIEELRQFFNDESQTFKKKLITYYRSYWHRLDLVVYVLFVIAVILRYTLPGSAFVWAQMFYVSTLSVYFLRFLQFFYVEKNIGPKVLAIQRMLYDLAFFLLILAVFLLSFGVGSQALLYPNSPATWSILYNVVSGPYFDIFGDINMDEYLGEVAGCSSNASVLENDPSIPECSVGNALAYIMLAIYMLLVNILLINLLIAMFSYTFSHVQENSGKVWRFYRCELVNEYFDKPPLPPPLIIISHTWMLVKFLFRKCTNVEQQKYKEQKHVKPDKSATDRSTPKQNTDFKQYLTEEDNVRLTAFERDSMELYYIKQRRGEQNLTDYKMNIATQKIDRMLAQLDQQRTSSRQVDSASHCQCNDTRVRLEQLEGQISRQLELLQAQLGSLSQSLDSLFLTKQLAASAQLQPTAVNVEIKDFDFGSSTS